MRPTEPATAIPPRPPLCVELHDVAPATWPLCRRLLQRIDALGRIPVSLLVVPEYHHREPITRDPTFLRAIGARLGRGDELALHGLHHLDEGPVARTPAEWVRRRLRTLSEGEFAATDVTVSSQRIARGLAEFVSAGWRVRGFVPPAWLLGDGARAALRGFGFSYVALRDRWVALPAGQAIPTTTLSYAAFSPWRRVLSRPLLDWQFHRAPALLPLRLALHPVDACHPAVLAHWERLLIAALATRTAMHAEHVVAHYLQSESPPSPTSGSRRARAGVASRP